MGDSQFVKNVIFCLTYVVNIADFELLRCSNLTNGEGGGGGFSCDSPEGGTIKKKPSNNKSALVTFKSGWLK